MLKKNQVQRACDAIPGFDEFYYRIKQRMSLNGRSQSSLTSYGNHLAKMALHFGCVPTTVDPSRINDYLYQIQQQRPSPSASYFKFAVYGLRFAYRMEAMPHRLIVLPSIKRDKKLPVVLSRNEIRRLLDTPKLFKHQILLMLLYGCGLRCGEVRGIAVRDLDFDRQMLHVKCGKGRKDRYVPLSELLIEKLKIYLQDEKPREWLFNGKPQGAKGGDFDSRYSQRGISWVVRHASINAGIIKNVSPHTLRHTYATHLLEDGLDIVSIKDVLGHESIATTMVYLHVAQYERSRAFSPLDTLYGLRKSNSSGAECRHKNEESPCERFREMLERAAGV